MDISPIIRADRQVIDSYATGGFRVASQWRDGAVIVFPDRTVPWPVSGLAELTAESLAPVFAEVPPIEVLLLGCGPKMVLLPAAFRHAVGGRGPSVDIMETGAACRTYNVLLSEERRVAAALLPV